MTMPSTRSPGQLQDELLDALRGAGGPMTVRGLYDKIKHTGPTNTGAVMQALRRLEKSGQVVDNGGTPITFSLTGTGTGVPSAATAGSAPAGSTPVGSALPAGPVTRPGGQRYFPREINGEPDIAVLRRLREASLPVLLYGPPGTGKTSLAEAAFPDLITVAGDSDTQVADLVGEYTQRDDGTYEWVYGPLVEAMRQGRPLFVDDASLIPPPVLAVLYPAMDGRGEIVIKAYQNEVVTAAAGFYVCGGHNPGVFGAHLTEALASRFGVHIEVTTDYDLARSLRVPAKVIAIAKELDQQRQDGKVSQSFQMRELLAFRDIARALGLDAALANLVSITPESDRDAVRRIIAGAVKRRPDPLHVGAQVKTLQHSQPPAPSSAAPPGASGPAPTTSSQP